MNLFLDTSVLLAAIGSRRGAAWFIIEEAEKRQWQLFSADYCAEEARRNWPKLTQPKAVSQERWETAIAPRIVFFPARVVLDRVLLFPKPKDRPVLVSALAAECDWLLTFDEGDFHRRLGAEVYGLRLGTPREFLLEQIRGQTL